jgi:hypothetical protein
MKKLLIFAAAIAFLFSVTAPAALYERIDNGSIRVDVKDNIVTIQLKDLNGDYKKIKFDRDDYASIEQFKEHFKITGGAGYHVEDELIIEGDKIIIDGETYSCGEFDQLRFSGEFDEGVTFSTELPYYKSSRNTSKKDITISRTSRDDKFGFGGLVIEAGETIYGDVVSLTGDIKVYGEVMGDIVAVFGDIEMYDGSYASGDVVAPFGRVIKTGSISIGGDTMPRKRLKVMGRESDVDFDLTARYNRVEGFTLIGGIYYEDKYHELPDFYFDAGYAFSLKRWDLTAGFRQALGHRIPFYFGADLFQGAATPDQWMFTTHENTLASLFFKEDYHDFYYRKGITGFMGFEFGRHGFIQAEYTAQDNEVLTKNTNKAIFGGKKNFRENYSTVEYVPGAHESIEGKRHTAALAMFWDSRDSEYWPRRGQLVELRLESAGENGAIGGLGGEHSFDRIEATFTNYLPVNRKQHIGLQIKAGHSDDDLPLDKWFFLGGPGSLRGYDYKEFAGNRFIMANLDYYFEFSNDFAVALFGDIGKASFTENQFEEYDYKSDLGVGILFRDAFRIDLAQRLDDTDESPVIFARALVHF